MMKRDIGNEIELNFLAGNHGWDETVMILAREVHFPWNLCLLEYMN